MLKLTPELTERVKKLKQMDEEERVKFEEDIIELIRDENNKNYSKMLASLSDDQLKQMLKYTLSIIKTD